MEGKLIKVENGYVLMVDNIMHATDNDKLSLKNCQAIENGYDLDELAVLSTKDETTIVGNQKMAQGFIKGFQKALEILGDKKFSEQDLKKSWSEGYHRKVDELNGNGLRYFDKFIQSLQQTEWDVVVEMDIDNPCPKCGEKDNVHGNYDYSNITRPLINTLCNECGTYFSPIPKLDADGCLILKRK